jgi:hypothetical protein
LFASAAPRDKHLIILSRAVFRVLPRADTPKFLNIKTLIVFLGLLFTDDGDSCFQRLVETVS